MHIGLSRKLGGLKGMLSPGCAKEKPAGGARGIMVDFLLRRLRRDVEVVPYYIRRYRNLPAYMITRAEADSLIERAKRPGAHHIQLPWCWAEFIKLGYDVDRGVSSLAHCEGERPYHTSRCAAEAVDEWGGGNTAPSLLRRLGSVSSTPAITAVGREGRNPYLGGRPTRRCSSRNC